MHPHLGSPGSGHTIAAQTRFLGRVPSANEQNRQMSAELSYAVSTENSSGKGQLEKNFTRTQSHAAETQLASAVLYAQANIQSTLSAQKNASDDGARDTYGSNLPSKKRDHDESKRSQSSVQINALSDKKCTVQLKRSEVPSGERDIGDGIKVRRWAFCV